MDLEKRIDSLIKEIESLKAEIGLIIPKFIKRILDKKLKSIGGIHHE
jgi:hypothetical protein